MCGIVGYVGKRNRIPVKVVLEGLKKLEYRGYDSAGVGGISNGEVLWCKEVGNITALEKQIAASNLSLDIAIGHTRWATHGKPSVINAHPQFDSKRTLAVVHNGIIENHSTLRRKLADQGVEFISETDTEVVAHLIAHYYQGDLLKALRQTVKEISGAYALAIVHKDYPETLFAVSHECPLILGIGEHEGFVASDSHAFTEFTQTAVYLGNSELATVTPEGYTIFNLDLRTVDKPSHEVPVRASDVSKGEFKHYTLKEIFEQPESIQCAIGSRICLNYGTAAFPELSMGGIDLPSIERILIVACGTSLYAGFVASYMIESKARIPVQVEISSEFRYKNPIVLPGTLTSKGAKVLSICNVQGSTMTRASDATILMHAGPEIGVCSTKAFTSQLTILSLLTLQLARTLHMSKEDGVEFIKSIIEIPRQVCQVLEQAAHIESLAKKYAKYDSFFFLGRSYLYPTSLEGALKLKEISYINANGYPAGEMKHGPIALINENCPTVALCANKQTFEKLMSNLMEVKARNGKIIAIASKGQNVSSAADDIIFIPETIDELSPILSAVACQLFAYYVAFERGAEIDQPRNLAKSVTVE